MALGEINPWLQRFWLSIEEETVDGIIILYLNMKAMVCSPSGDTDYFDIATGVFQGDI